MTVKELLYIYVFNIFITIIEEYPVKVTSVLLLLTFTLPTIITTTSYFARTIIFVTVFRSNFCDGRKVNRILKQ